ncbi:hypothetical protein ZIOFF_017285 [Zingiber officinale]|uniref:Deoxyuridine 5'-triphosphate nucleotidohydrolase n=1 Tax=Zingiber officinale TaxID=94328 RepID=A0A8J5HNI5_ZINOF|nr:hypothetical protein ZIOFF_017285 [Zingiber officinale]
MTVGRWRGDGRAVVVECWRTADPFGGVMAKEGEVAYRPSQREKPSEGEEDAPARFGIGEEDRVRDLGLEKKIVSRDRELLSTDLAMIILEGCYGRITPISGISWEKGIIICAGVIDCEYQGDVKILVFNMTFEPLTLQKGEAVAQIILERIITPEGNTIHMGTPEWDDLISKLLPVHQTVREANHLYTLTDENEWLNPFFMEAGGGNFNFNSDSDSFITADSDWDNDEEQILSPIYDETLANNLDMDYPIIKTKMDNCSIQLIDRDAVFNVTGLEYFTKSMKLDEHGLSYAIVSIMGSQSSVRALHSFVIMIEVLDGTLEGIRLSKRQEETSGGHLMHYGRSIE